MQSLKSRIFGSKSNRIFNIMFWLLGQNNNVLRCISPDCCLEKLFWYTVFISLPTCARSEFYIEFNLYQSDNQEMVSILFFNSLITNDVDNFSCLLDMFSSVDRIFCLCPLVPVCFLWLLYEITTN